MIIIDISTGWTSDVLVVVADALAKLKGDLPKGRVPRQALQKYVCDEEQDSHPGPGHLLTWTSTIPHHLLPINTWAAVSNTVTSLAHSTVFSELLCSIRNGS